MHQHRHTNAPETRGITIHWAKQYDKLAIWQLLTLGRGVKLWDEMLDQSGINPGDRVLDVGCGPGTLTLKAKARAGQTGQVVGIDASPEMIAAAKEKAQRAGAQVDFQLEAVEKLSFPDSSFDVVLSSLMMHHLPDDVKRQGLAEIWRVLKPGGCLMIFDFKRPGSHLKRISLLGLLHRSLPPDAQDLGALLEETGYECIESSDTQIKMFAYWRGTARK